MATDESRHPCSGNISLQAETHVNSGAANILLHRDNTRPAEAGREDFAVVREFYTP
ncbi:MAG: hypothetical protein WCL37_07175 [Chrysiogenales bacterium]